MTESERNRRGSSSDPTAFENVASRTSGDMWAVEAIDRVTGEPDVTAWRRAARRHQTLWRECHDWPIGRQRVSANRGGGFRPIGSRIEEDFARRHGVNFISDAARRAAEHRLQHPERHQTLDATRLYCDLLSSMPMCFNLLGPLWADGKLAAAVAQRWFPDFCSADASVEVRFEWSPGRGDARWLNDRTAFDAMLTVTTADARRLIGIETKYHEHAAVDPVVRRRRGVEQRRQPKARYSEVTETARLFAAEDWLESIWGHDVEQIWRDHLLALACQQGMDDLDDVLYVLIAPAANPAWSRVGRRYASMLTPQGQATFQCRALDDLVSTAADLLPDASTFDSRYLAVALAPKT